MDFDRGEVGNVGLIGLGLAALAGDFGGDRLGVVAPSCDN